MRYIKQLNLSSKQPQDNSLVVTQDKRIITDTMVSLQIPAGSTADRPATSTWTDGMIRFNSTKGEFEVYNSINGNGWESLRTIRQAVITPQNLGYGNYHDTIFGPLSYNIDINKPQNILVFVDNVYQIPNTNYTLTSDPTPSTATITVSTSSGVSIIYVNTTTNIDLGEPGYWRTVSSAYGIQVGTTVTSVSSLYNVNYKGYAIGLSLPTTTIINSGTLVSFSYQAGTFIEFTGPVPAKPVFALLGFDGYWIP